MTNPHKIVMTRNLNKEINAVESRNSVEIVNSRPLRVGVDLSNVCNINCIFCLARDSRQQKSSPNAFRSAAWLNKINTLLPFMDHVIFSSYEAILAPEFPNAVEMLRRYYTPFNIFTNGLALTPELSKYCLENGLASINCSFHAADKATYQSIMRGSDYNTVLRNLLSLKAQAERINPAFRLTMVFCAMRRNIHELPAYVDLAYAVGAKVIQVNYLLVTHGDTGLEGEAMFFNQHRYDRNVRLAKAKAARLGIKLQHQPTFRDYTEDDDMIRPCYRPWEHLIVTQAGSVQICCGGTGNQGNIFEQDFFSVWNNDMFQEFRRRVNTDDPPKACRSCTRGRENPFDPTVHLTYLRKLPKKERQQRLAELMREFGQEGSNAMPVETAECSPCSL